MKEIKKSLGEFMLERLMPPEGKFVLICNSPHQDFPEAVETSENKDYLIKKGKKMRSNFYSSLKIYNHKQEELWKADLPSTF